MDALRRERVGEVLAAALRLPAAERYAFIAEACGGEEDLKAEVASLAAAAGSVGGFLGRPTVGAAGAATGVGEGPGAVIGRYRLLERLGEGGFGAVYLAEQREPVRRTVAFKILKPGMDTREVIARFEAERQALALMEHPNIARVLDAGATESGRPYFVMELVRGEPITRYCDAHRLTMRERVVLFTRVCLAVQHAHTKGVIHRDLKPANVLVEEGDAGAMPKVIDFGIAKALRGPRTNTRLTAIQQLIGTPEYMSPEQAEMSGADLDTRTDIYSLGVVLYELLTGLTPFEPERLRAAGWSELHRIIREEEPARPSTRVSTLGESARGVAIQRRTEPSRLAAVVRGDLDWVVMKCLEKDPARRYQTANGLARDLERHVAGEAVEAAPPQVSYRIRKFVGRHRFGAMMGGVVAAALVLGVTGTTAGLVHARWERDRARAAESEQSRLRTQAELEAAKRAAVNAFLGSMLGAADPAQTRGRRGMTVREALDEAVRSLDAGRLAKHPEVEQAARATLARTYLELGETDAARTQADCSWALLEQVGGTARDKVQTLTILARTELDRGRPAEGEPWARRAIEIAERDLGPGHRDTGVSIGALATCLNGMGRSEEAEQLHRRQLEILLVAPSPDGTRDEDLSAALNDLAVMADERGQLDEAIPLMQRALEHARAEGGDAPNVLVRQRNLASMLRRSGDLPGAESIVTGMLADCRRVFGDRHVRTGLAYNELGMILAMRGDRPGAEDAIRQAVPIFSEQLGDTAIQSLSARSNLARLLELRGARDEAVEMRSALVLQFEACQVAAAPERTENLLRLGLDQLALGRTADGEQSLRAAVAYAEEQLPDGHKHAWLRYLAMSGLSEAIATRAETASGEERQERFKEAERLALAAAERIDPPPSTGGVKRAVTERVAKVYEAWHRADPTAGHDAAARQWRERVAAIPGPPGR